MIVAKGTLPHDTTQKIDNLDVVFLKFGSSALL